MINEVLERSGKKKTVYEIIGISREQYDLLYDRYVEEFMEILRTGKFVEAGIKLLKWLGVADEDITTDNIVKSVIVMKTIIHYANKASKERRPQAGGGA